MKRVSTIIIILLLAIDIAAQVEQPRRKFEIGAVGGVNLNQMDFQPTIRQKYIMGMNGGIFARYTSEKYFSMICAAQLEINFAQRGWDEDFDDDTENCFVIV